jgi:hypothetical protein
MKVPTIVSHSQVNDSLKKGGNEKEDNDLTKKIRGDVQQKQ